LGPGKGGRYRVSSNATCDINRAKELGYKPKPIEDSLEEYAAWIKNEIKRLSTC
jgi:nucleoside-diphosphate-sugar epimerase